MKTETRVWTLDELILANRVKLGRGNIISKKDIVSFPGEYPIYSSAREKNGTFGFYGKYMFDEELITWSIDGGGRLFYRPRHKFSVTNVGGTLRILDTDFLDCRYMHLVLTHLHSKIRFDWVYKAHPSVIRMVYNEIPIPSLEKQHEIVAKLDSAFAEIDSLEENFRLLEISYDELLHSVQRFSYGSNVSMVKIGEVCKLMTGGTPSRTRKDFFKNGTVKWLVSGDIHKGEIFDCEGRITVEAMKSANTKFLPMNSVMIALNGQGKTRGTVALLRTEATCNQSLVSISPASIEELMPEFLFYNLKMRYQELRRMTGDDGNDRRGLNMILIREIEIPLPAIVRQIEIVNLLKSAEHSAQELKCQIELKKQQAKDLRKSLLSKSFNKEAAVG